MSRLTIYSRPDCGLCEEMAQQLAGLVPDDAVAIEVVDVDRDPDLARRYGHRIPVLCIDGEFICAYRLDVARVRDRLGLPGANAAFRQR
jgi:glutaredoxin